MLFERRCAGVLLPLFSLPKVDDDGDLGHQAYRFIEFLHGCGCKIWQLLPVGPVHLDGSPYLSLSAHAGNEQLLSLDWLRDRGWLDESMRHSSRVDQLRLAYEGFLTKASAGTKDQFQQFQLDTDWLLDYASFVVIRAVYDFQPWLQWPAGLRNRDTLQLTAFRQQYNEEIQYQCFLQYVFTQQWLEFKQYANQHDVKLFGDMPLFVSLDSADVWASPDLFDLDKERQPRVVAGTPPDYFAKQGQRWGNPLYHWENMENDGFNWWLRRIHTQFQLYDVLRIDHFRGLQACWEIPADAATAKDGHWVTVPGEQLLKTMHQAFGSLPLVAEDLGTITEEVNQLRELFSIPGMRVLQFGFDGDPDNPHAPHNVQLESVVYTGTHDNNTSNGWFDQLSESERQNVSDYLACSGEAMPWPLIKSALASVSQCAILPLQDLLSLGTDARINTPGTVQGNWQWRFKWEQIPVQLAEQFRTMLHRYGRL